MQLKLISKYGDELPIVTNPSLRGKRIYYDDALFSLTIFGPLVSYKCKCGVNKKYLEGQRCPQCGVLITSSTIRRYATAKIKLPFKIIHPFIFDKIFGVKSSKLRHLIVELLKGTPFKIENDKLKTTDNIKEADFIFTKNFDKLLEYLHQKNPNNLLLKILYDNKDNCLTDEVLVLPPDLRPIINEKIIDDLNEHYALIIELSNRIRQNPMFDEEKFKTFENIEEIPLEIVSKFLLTLQKRVHNLYLYIIDKLKGKKGLLRANMLGKRVDFSGRGVIVVDPKIPLGYAKIPYIMLLELFKLQLANKLVSENRETSIQSAIEKIDEAIFLEDNKYRKDIEEIIKDEWVMLNRQPSLHRMNIMGFKIMVGDGYTIGINPLICPPYNADFDGDSVFGCIKLKIKYLNSNNNFIESDNSLTLTTHISELADMKIKVSPLNKLEIVE